MIKKFRLFFHSVFAVFYYVLALIMVFSPLFYDWGSLIHQLVALGSSGGFLFMGDTSFNHVKAIYNE